MTWLSALAGSSLIVWLYLLLGRDGFWRARPRIEDETPPPPGSWPAVVAIVPARNEAAHVEDALRSLLVQDYPGELAVVLVDDHSNDGTGALAAGLKRELGVARHPDVIGARPLPVGWSGKLWAIAAGLRHAEQTWPDAAYVLLTDADIAHHPGSLARLVAKAEAERLDLTSLMVRLRCETFWEAPHSALRVLLSEALSVCHRQRPHPADRGRRRRVHAGPAPGARGSRWHRGDPRRTD